MKSRLSLWFPFLRWPRPTATSLAADARAGLAVGLVIVPQAVAYAVLAGMPPITGLYAALLPAVIGVLWGSCLLLGTGPTALSAMLVAGSLTGMAAPGSPEWVQLAIWLALLSGTIQVALGLLRLGSIVNFLSGPVIGAFTQAAAVLILLSQLGSMLGLNTPGLWASVRDAGLSGALAHVHWGGMAFGVTTLALLIGLKRFSKRWPVVLMIGVVCGTISWLAAYPASGGAVVGALPAGLPGLVWPGVPDWEALRALLPTALVIALVCFIEALSSARVICRAQRTPWYENRELVGQGLAKIAAGASGGFPVSASFSRSALMLQAGAVSGWSVIFTVLCVLGALLWLTPALSWLPTAFLAATIVVSVLNLIQPSWFVHLWRTSRSEAVVGGLTFVATLIAAPQLQWGVLTGFVLAMLHYLYQRSHPRMVEVGPHPDGTLRDLRRFQLPRLAPDLFVVRMDASLNFVTAVGLERFVLDACRSDPAIRRVMLHGAPINDLDSTGADALANLQAVLADQGITLLCVALKKQAEDALRRAGVLHLFAEGTLYPTERAAIEALRQSA